MLLGAQRQATPPTPLQFLNGWTDVACPLNWVEASLGVEPNTDRTSTRRTVTGLNPAPCWGFLPSWGFLPDWEFRDSDDGDDDDDKACAVRACATPGCTVWHDEVWMIRGGSVKGDAR